MSSLKAGDILKRQRVELGYTLDQVSKKVGVSINYISEMERNNKTNPSDEIIVKLAEVYKLGEDDLFNLFGKVPLSAKEEVRSNPNLIKALSQLSRDEKLTTQEKDMLYEKLIQWYEKMIKGDE